MSKPPPRRTSDPRSAAEAVFKKATTKPAEPVPPTSTSKPAVPAGKELVSLRIDRDVLEPQASSSAPGAAPAAMEAVPP